MNRKLIIILVVVGAAACLSYLGWKGYEHQFVAAAAAEREAEEELGKRVSAADIHKKIEFGMSLEELVAEVGHPSSQQLSQTQEHTTRFLYYRAHDGTVQVVLENGKVTAKNLN